jgi:hypothetical protein
VAEGQGIYFDGSGGCDACDAMTGYYLDQPGGPHPHCNCSSETVAVDVECVLRNVAPPEEARYHVEIEDVLDNCGNNTPAWAPFSVGEDREESFDFGLREAVEAAGWRAPEPRDLTAIMEVPANTFAQVTLVIERYTARFHAEVWARRADGTEQYVGDAQGTYESTLRIERAWSDKHPCVGRYEKWLPRPDDDHDSEAGTPIT